MGHRHSKPSLSFFFLGQAANRTEGRTVIRCLISKSLRRQNATIEKIGEEVGYEDPASFRRLFKRKSGLTPAEYRRLFGRRRFERYNLNG